MTTEETKNKSDKKESCMGCFSVFFMCILSTILSALFSILVIRQFTTWFIVPLDRSIANFILNIHWAHLLGLLSLKSFLVNHPISHNIKSNYGKESHQETFKNINLKLVFSSCVKPIITLALGYFFYLCM